MSSYCWRNHFLTTSVPSQKKSGETGACLRLVTILVGFLASNHELDTSQDLLPWLGHFDTLVLWFRHGFSLHQPSLLVVHGVYVLEKAQKCVCGVFEYFRTASTEGLSPTPFLDLQSSLLADRISNGKEATVHISCSTPLLSISGSERSQGLYPLYR